MVEQVLLHPTYFPSIAQFHLMLNKPCAIAHIFTVPMANNP